MAKTDVKSALCIIPIHPADYFLLGMKRDNLYYFDRCLTMGLSSSCAIFESFSRALEWLGRLAINHFGACTVLHILDDFLFYRSNQRSIWAWLGEICLTVQLSWGSSGSWENGWSQYGSQFAGIMLDSARLEVRLPEDKLHKCRVLLKALQIRRSVCLRELRSLLGLLNFTCLVVVSSRAFLRRLIDLTMCHKATSSNSYL